MTTYLPKELLADFDAKQMADTTTSILDSFRQHIAEKLNPTPTPAPLSQQPDTTQMAPIRTPEAAPMQTSAPAAPESVPTIPQFQLPSVDEILGTPGVSNAPGSDASGATPYAGPESAPSPPSSTEDNAPLSFKLPSVDEILGKSAPEQPTMGAQPITGAESVPTGAPAPVQRGPSGDPNRDYARQAAVRAGIDPDIFERQIQQESGFNPNAGSPAGAQGIAQIVPKFHPGVDPFDPKAALDYAADLMASNLKQYGGDYAKALAAYNAGPGAVAQYGGVPPFEETQRYVKTILGDGQRNGAVAQSTNLPRAGDSTSAAFAGGELTPNQFTAGQSLSSEDASAACGPAAAIAFARRNGRNPTLDEAVSLAKQVGWTSSQGMAGPQSEVSLLNKMGVAASLASPNEQRIAADVQRGNPVILDTPGHYFVAEKYDPQSGKFDFGNSAGILRAAAHQTWFTLGEIANLGMGAIRAAIHMDNPESPSPSVVAGKSASDPQPDRAPALVQAVDTATGAQPGDTAPDPGNAWSTLDFGGLGAGDRIKGVPVAQALRSGNTMAMEDLSESTNDGTGNRVDSGDLGRESMAVPTSGISSPPTRDVRGDYAPAAVEPGDYSLPSVTAPPSSAQPADTVEPSAAPVSAGEPTDPWSRVGHAIKDALGGIMNLGGKPDYQQAAQDIQGRSQATAAPGEPSIADVVQPVSDVMQRGAESPSLSRQLLTTLAPGMTPEGNQRQADERARLSELNAKDTMFGGPGLTPAEQDELTQLQKNQGLVVGMTAPGPGPGMTGAVRPSRGGGQAVPLAESQPITMSADDEIKRLRLDKEPEQIQNILRDTLQANDFARTGRRGVITDEAARAAADQSTASLEDWIRSGKPGKTYTKEQITALRDAGAGQADKVRTLSEQISEAEQQGQVTDLLKARMVIEGKRLSDFLTTVKEPARAESGRTLQAWKTATRAIDSDPAAAIEHIYQRLGGRENVSDVVNEFTKMTQQGATPIQMSQFWARVDKPPPNAGDWFRTIRYNSMLSGPRTAEVNIGGGGMEIPWRLVRDTAASTMRGRPEEIKPELAGMWEGMKRGADAFMETLQHGITEEQALRGDLPRGLAPRISNPIGRGVATALESTGRVLQASDEFLNQTAFNMVRYRRAAMDASAAGLRGEEWSQRVAENIANPGNAELKYAREAADRITYKNEMGGLGNALLPVHNHPLGNLVVSFLKTVYNITARGIDRSPLGIVGTAAEALTPSGRDYLFRGGTKKGVAPLGERLGDNAMGGALGVFLIGKALDGNVSGSGPDDTEKKNQLRAEGWQPYAVKLGGHWVSYANWGPWAVPFAEAAAVGEAINYRKPEAGNLEMYGDALRRFGELATEQTYLQGIGGFYKAVKEPDVYGSQWLTQFLQTLIPFGAAINTVGQASDEFVRRPERYNVGQALEGRFPGLRESVPVAQDVLGRPVHNEQQGGGAFQPLRISEQREDPVISAFQAAGVDIGAPKKQLTIDTLKTDLTPAEQRAWQTYRGNILQKSVGGLVQRGTFDQMNAAAKEKALKTALDDAGRAADQLIARDIGRDDLRRRLLEKKAS